MCGIAGWLGNLEGTDAHVLRIIKALRHRGPDANGWRCWPHAGLIHTRLSIIDLTPTGAQPMANEDGTVWTIFNGEIYNHRSLRRELEADGHLFRGRSDTEILPHLYEKEGVSFLRRLRGMFALAIYDTRRQSLLLARDRYGIKPLFYAATHERLMFASELNALREMPGIDTRPDSQAISDFAALCYIPAPLTFFRGIRAVLPGEVVEARLEGDAVDFKCHTYHKWNVAPVMQMTPAQAEEQTAELLSRAVPPQMESDVPLGTLLSGGIDSSLVSAAAQAILDGELRTFNVRFPEPRYDETWAAETVSRHIGSHHTTLDLGNVPGTWDYITGLLRHAGQPFADTSIFAVDAVSRLMRQHVTVALSGDGGDEAFGGYALFRWIASIARWQSLPASVSRGTSAALSSLARFAVIPQRLPQRLAQLADADDTAVIQNLLCWVREDEHRSLCRNAGTLPVRRLFEPQWQHDHLSRASRLERLSAHATEVYTRLVMPNDFLFKVDTASMRQGLEIRVPMLDENLFAFGLSLPHSLKVNGRTCKTVLRGVARHWLPAAVAAKPKRGFEVPVDAWVTSDFKTGLRETLLGQTSKLPEFFRPDAYVPIVEAFCEGRTTPSISREGLYQRAIMLLSLQTGLGTTS